MECETQTLGGAVRGENVISIAIYAKSCARLSVAGVAVKLAVKPVGKPARIVALTVVQGCGPALERQRKWRWKRVRYIVRAARSPPANRP